MPPSHSILSQALIKKSMRLCQPVATRVSSWTSSQKHQIRAVSHSHQHGAGRFLPYPARLPCICQPSLSYPSTRTVFLPPLPRCRPPVANLVGDPRRAVGILCTARIADRASLPPAHLFPLPSKARQFEALWLGKQQPRNATGNSSRYHFGTLSSL